MHLHNTDITKETKKDTVPYPGATTPIEKDREDQKTDTQKDEESIGTPIEDARDEAEKKDDSL